MRGMLVASGVVLALVCGTSALAADEPTVTILRAPHTIKLTSFLKSGLDFEVRFSGDCQSTAVLVVSKRTAIRQGIGKKLMVLGSIDEKVAAGTYTATMKPNRLAKRLKGHRRVPAAFGLTCVGADGHEDLDSINVTIKG